MMGMTPEQYQASVAASVAAFSQRHEDRKNSEWVPVATWDRLGIHEWITVMRECGYWEFPEEPVEEFWKRAIAYVAERSDRPEYVPLPQPSASPETLPASLQEPATPAVPPSGADPDWALG